jgi:hypothetical protein
MPHSWRLAQELQQKLSIKGTQKSDIEKLLHDGTTNHASFTGIELRRLAGNQFRFLSQNLTHIPEVVQCISGKLI